MRALSRKLWRNLWELKGQWLAIGLVIASGVAMYTMSQWVLSGLLDARADFYREQHFAQVFVEVQRAPRSLAARAAALPGVALVEARIKAPLNVRLPGFDGSISGLGVSLPDGRQPSLNRLYLRAGQLPLAYRDDQVVVSEAFAEAHALQPGAQFAIVINGRLRTVTATGIALSPEYIYQVKPGEMIPDFSRYAIVWLNQSALEAAFDMEGAFNSLAISVTAAANVPALQDELDALLANWGGAGAYGRDEQMSHRFLEEELKALAVMARLLPVIFLGVGTFLLNVVVARLIRTQREQIAMLKAFGYSSAQLGWHYLQLVTLAAAPGALAGLALGRWLAGGLGGVYQQYYRFPELPLDLNLSAVAVALGATFVAAGLGAAGSIRAAMALAPAEAMRPEAPAHYRTTWLERLGVGFSQPTRIALRNLARMPIKALFSCLAVALAVAMLMVSGFQRDAIGYMINTQFYLANRQDFSVTFFEPVAARAVFELQALPGVQWVEPQLQLSVELRRGQYHYRTALQGLPAHSELSKLLTRQLEHYPVAGGGLYLSAQLGQILKLRAGDWVEVKALTGRRQVVEMPVAGLVEDYVGVNAYATAATLEAYMDPAPGISGALLAVDTAARQGVEDYLRAAPAVAGVSARADIIANFEKSMNETVLAFSLFALGLAGAMAFAVVYNNARIALAERGRELASLRVLGLTRAEVARILLTEIALVTALAIPLGFAIGWGFCALITYGMQTDIYRIPLVVTPATLGIAATTVIAATLGSAVVVIKRVRDLDLLAALKAKE